MISSRSSRARYVGYTRGTENHGDEALVWLIADLLEPEIEVVLDGEDYDLALLGGGTLINQSPWLIDLFEKALQRAGRGVVFGTGVGDTFFWGDHFARWIPLLSRCEFVGVRGPDSLALLQEHGCAHARCIGDPYLMLRSPVAREPVPRRLGVNLGSTHDSHWGGPDAPLLERVGQSLRALKAEGWNFLWFSVWSKDLPLLEDLRRRIDPASLPVLDVRSDTLRALAALSGCDLVLAEKLHACAMAAVAGVPFVALEYQPKVHDFAASLGMQDWVVRTDFTDPAAIVGKVLLLKSEREAIAERLKQVVEEKRILLRDFAGAVRGREAQGRHCRA